MYLDTHLIQPHDTTTAAPGLGLGVAVSSPHQCHSQRLPRISIVIFSSQSRPTAYIAFLSRLTLSFMLIFSTRGAGTSRAKGKKEGAKRKRNSQKVHVPPHLYYPLTLQCRRTNLYKIKIKLFDLHYLHLHLVHLSRPCTRKNSPASPTILHRGVPMHKREARA
jgi:hypothetical protein